MDTWLHAADIFFLVFHSALTLFNAFGWILKKTRKLNLITLLLTGGSWFVLGIFYGLGYCPLTEWHFQVLRKLGETNLPTSYIKYLAHRISGIAFDAELVDALTGIVFFIALVMSAVLNIKDWKKAGR